MVFIIVECQMPKRKQIGYKSKRIQCVHLVVHLCFYSVARLLWICSVVQNDLWLAQKERIQHLRSRILQLSSIDCVTASVAMCVNNDMRVCAKLILISNFVQLIKCFLWQKWKGGKKMQDQTDFFCWCSRSSLWRLPWRLQQNEIPQYNGIFIIFYSNRYLIYSDLYQ